MKVFIVAYCFGGLGRQSLIGVYKRALRVGHALCDRGHEVAFHCAGRDNYHDAMTERAGQRMEFLDWPWERPIHEGAEHNRQQTLDVLRRAAPHLVLIGEAPLAGPLLEVTLAAAELGLPLVCLDNAYNPDAAEGFCRRHGSIYDGIVLTGPSSFHTRRPPAFLLQVPPYIESSPEEARAFVASLGLGGRRLMTVLAYDVSVEALGASIVAKLGLDDVGAVFITNRPDTCRQRLELLPPAVQARVRVVEPLDDRRHFGVLQESRLAVGKCAFMQVSECLSLRTPIIGFYFHGDFHLDYIPAKSRPFTHMTADPAADDETIDRARHFLRMWPWKMRRVHDGRLGATDRTVAFLEQLPKVPRDGTVAECRVHGLSPDLLQRAIGPSYPGADVRIVDVRMSVLREFRQQLLFTVLCRYTVDGAVKARRLWFRRFRGDEALRAEVDRARQPELDRTVLYTSIPDRVLIEHDIGEAALPSLHEAAAS
jgi:hypothetical protein